MSFHELTGFYPLTTRHCVTGSLRHIYEYHGFPISEDLLLGLGSGLGFIYWHVKGTPPLFGGRACIRIEQQADRRPDGGQGGPELVRDGREQVTPQPLELFETKGQLAALADPGVDDVVAQQRSHPALLRRGGLGDHGKPEIGELGQQLRAALGRDRGALGQEPARQVGG